MSAVIGKQFLNFRIPAIVPFDNQSLFYLNFKNEWNNILQMINMQ